MVTKKRQSSGLLGLGVKFGATVRKRYGKAYHTLKRKRKCPLCGSQQFGRVASGIWFCRKCKYKVAAGAYDIDIEKLQR